MTTAAAQPAEAPPLLQLEGINTYYGQIHILQDSNLVVREGELVCLLGGNASGKSTTLKTILGLVRPRTGRVLLAGEDVTRLPTAHRIRRGLAIVPENRRLFGPMTVLQNLEMGAYLRPRADLKEEFERVYSLFPLLYERRSQLAGTLSGGEQQMVAMGRALMSKPRLLLMDEPSMGLAPILVERSFEIIEQVNDAGVAMLVVEQNANVSLSIADRGYVLSTGRDRARGQGRRPARGRGPAEGLPWPLRRGRVGAAIRGEFPIFETRDVPQLLLAGRALAPGARRRRGVARRLGRERRRVGLLGRAERGVPHGASRGCSTPRPTTSPSRRRSRRA